TPWIFPGSSGMVTFSVVADSPDGTGSYLCFTAPTYTDPHTGQVSHNATITGVTLSDPALEGKYTVTSDDDGHTVRLTLAADDVLWSDCIVTLAVDSSMPKFATLDNGSVQYTSSDDQPVGSSALFTVITASSNGWDNVASVESCLIGMQSDDTSRVNKGTLFMNGDWCGNATSVFAAHSIPVFVGITFKLFSDNFEGPTDDEVLAALSLVGLATDGQTIIDVSDDFVLTSDTTFRNAYYRPTASFPEPEVYLQSGGYVHEYNLGAWCPKFYNDTLPGDIAVYLHLEAPLSTGTYIYTSNGETPANLIVNFISQKKYQYSDTSGSSDYLLVHKEPASDSLKFNGNGEVRNVSEILDRSIHRIYIDSTPEQYKYVFSFKRVEWMLFSYPSVDSSYYGYGTEIRSLYLHGVKEHGNPQWVNYGQFLLLPDYSYANSDSAIDLTNSLYIESSHDIGPAGTHEAHGWACCGELKVSGDGITINSGEIAFAAFSGEFEDTTKDIVWDKNNNQNESGQSPIRLRDNFGNNIYMIVLFDAGETSTSITLTIKDS
ncbi:TPA: hypothetical protein N2F56_004348, partial [Salmonella enterica]|nr:hypothetical protein [Salmonella enterica]